MNLIDAFITLSKQHFKYKDNPDKQLKDYYIKALGENRIKLIRDNNKIVGFLVWFLWTKEQLDERLKNDGSFTYPDSNINSDYLYIDNCIIFNSKGQALIKLRRLFREEFPQIKYVCWHKSIEDTKKLFKIKYDGGNYGRF